MDEREPGLERHELEALLETRHELGAAYDAELVAAFAERIEAEVDRRSELARRDVDGGRGGGGSLTLGLVSLGTGIPITAIAGSEAGVGGVALAWLGIAGVNAAHAWTSRRRGR